MSKFTVYHDDNSSFVDYTFESEDFGTESYNIELISTQDYLYIGYKKPFSTFFIEMATANTNSNTLAAEYYHEDNAAWTSLDITDHTKGFTQSGFVEFDKPVDDKNSTVWGEVEINSTTLYWIRLKPSADHSAGTSIQGLNILFSNDQDLIEERSNIVSKHNSGNSWVLKHQAAKKDIIQEIRNRGNTIKKASEGWLKNVVAHDLLEYSEVRQASKYLTLAKIYLQELQDEIDDKWQVMGDRFKGMYEKAMDLFFLKIDKDDDGEQDHDDVASGVRSVGIVRR